MTSTTTQAAPQPMDQQQADQLLDAVSSQIEGLRLAITALADATWNGDGSDMSAVRFLPDGATADMTGQLRELTAALAGAAHQRDTFGFGA